MALYWSSDCAACPAVVAETLPALGGLRPSFKYESVPVSTGMVAAVACPPPEAIIK